MGFLDKAKAAANDRPGADAERERILGTLREIEQRGGIPSFALQTSAPPPSSVPPTPPSWAKPDDT